MLDPNRAKGGFADLVGYDLVRWDPDGVAVTLTVAEQHQNRSGAMHGGVLTTLIDTACGYAGCYAPPGAEGRRAFTLSLNTHFIFAAQKGMVLTATARQTGGGRSIFFATCEVTNQDGKVIGRGEGTFKYIQLRR
ncbi:MAG: PaaI family thioesterase [Pseudomonadota bacterium]